MSNVPRVQPGSIAVVSHTVPGGWNGQADMLQRLGHECVPTCRGEDAIAAFDQARSDGAPFGAVLLDLTIVGGEEMGYSICVESGKGLTIDGEERALVHRATNVFRREADGWKLIHHHTDGSIAGN